MGEIKSTLDLIMEKTKDLTLSEQEKRFFKQKEIEAKMKGLVQKRLDEVIQTDMLRQEIENLDEERKTMALDILRRECVQRMSPVADNGPLLDLLHRVAGMDPATFQEVLKAFREDLEEKRSLAERKIRRQLSEKGISGSAIMPNLAADVGWQKYVREKKENLKTELSSLLGKTA